MAEWSVDIHHEAGMRLVVGTGSGHALAMDDGERDSGPRPTELLLAALGGCLAMDVLSILRKKRQEVARFDVRVRADQREAYPRIFTVIDVLVEVEGPRVSVAAVRAAIELAAGKYCQVGAMLAAGDTAIHHHYRVIGTGATAFDESGDGAVSGPFARPDLV